MTTRRLLTAAVLGLAVCLGVGCAGSKEEIPPAEVSTVEAYGLVLDENASPKQVVFVLLRSIADDVRAAQAHQRDEQRAALRTTFALAAYSEIERRLLQGRGAGAAAKGTLGKDRDREIYEIVKLWAPIAGHYIRGFDTDVQAAAGRMRVLAKGDHTANVLYDVVHDPAETDPSKQSKATLDIELLKEPAGGKSYWRVVRVGFTARAKPVTKPTTSPAATAPATPPSVTNTAATPPGEK